MAGLLPHLQQGDIPGSQDWIYLNRMVPTTHPLESLAIKLALREEFLLQGREDVTDFF